MGRGLLAVVEREGINRECVLVDAEGNTGIIIGLIDNATSEEAHIITDPQASCLPEAYINEVRDVFGRVNAAVIAPGISAQGAVRAVEICAEQLVPPVVVFQFRPHEFLTPEQLDTLTKHVDFFLGTAANLRYLLSLRTPIEAGADALGIARRVQSTYGFRAVCTADGVFGGAYVDEGTAL